MQQTGTTPLWMTCPRTSGRGFWSSWTYGAIMVGTLLILHSFNVHLAQLIILFCSQYVIIKGRTDCGLFITVVTAYKKAIPISKKNQQRNTEIKHTDIL